MKRFAAALVTVSTLVAAAPSLACETLPYDSRRVEIRADRLPSDMLRDAARVDVAIAVAYDPIDIDAWQAEAWRGALAKADTPEGRARIAGEMHWEKERLIESGFGRVRYRVVETLKGPSEAEVRLTGFFHGGQSLLADGFDPDDGPARRGGYTDPQAVYDAESWVQADVWGGLGSCTVPVTAIEGGRYLIFRAADGRLLGETDSALPPYRENQYLGPVYTALADNDPWLARVRQAAGRAR